MSSWIKLLKRYRKNTHRFLQYERLLNFCFLHLQQETDLANGEKLVATITEELNYLKDQDKNLTTENQAMSSELNDVKLQLQKISYESKESAITVESLRETNQELQAELEELKKSLTAMRSAQKVNVDEEKIKRKADKMAEMMAGFDPSVSC